MLGISRNHWIDVRKQLLLLLFIALSAGKNLPAQNPFIHHYTTFDGLPSNTVYYIYQDSKKFIWFATDAGVARYDGTSFTNFRKNDGLSSNEVIRIKGDSSGRIWFFNLNGRLNFFWQNRIFNSTNAPFLDSIKNKIFFNDFFESQDRVIYFYNNEFEIFALNNKNKVEKYETDRKLIKVQTNCKCNDVLGLRYISRNSAGENIAWTRCEIIKLNSQFNTPVKIFNSFNIWKVFPGRNKSYYISAYHNGVFKVTGEFEFKPVPLEINMSYDYRGVTSILEDADGYIWIVTFDKGVYCVYNDRIVRHLDVKEGQSVIQDNENNIWISSMKDGVYKISPYLNAFMHYENSCFQNMGITALDAKPGRGLWFTNGKLIYFLNKNNLFTLNKQVDDIQFNQICQIKNNALIAGEKGSFYYAFNGIVMDPVMKKISYKSFTKILYNFNRIAVNERENEISTIGNLEVFIYTIQKQFLDFSLINIGERVYNIFYNVNDDLIINAKNNYLWRNQKLFPCDYLSRFNHTIITDHLILNDSIELFNIEGDSIYLYNKFSFFNLTAAFGFAVDQQIRNISYREPSLFLATSNNIYKCDHPSNIFLGKPVHLQLVDINFRNIHDIAVNKDSLYIASDDGLTIIPEALIGKITTHTPIPYFQSILINDKETDYSGQEVVSGNNNKITVNYSCINYSSTPILYSYKLDGLDTVWTTGTSRNVVYQSLKRGNYVFQLRVRKPSAAWSVPVECRIIVKAAFWQHPLFYLSLFLLFTGLLIFFIIRRKNIQMKRREIDHQLITLEQKALQSMMNPHFIFNSLGSIQNYLLQKKSGEAALYLSQFARLIRQNLNAINSANINLEEEVDRLQNYLDLEKLRMEDKFDYLIEVDENLEADEILIPSMIIQPFIENAIWHGISTLQEKGLITIRFRKKDNRSLKITIKDNGIGMQKSRSFSQKSEKHFHLGMEMTRRRLDLLGKKHSIDTSIESCEVSPGLPNPGTRIVLVVPISYSEAES
jgi:hypothetical protein